MNKIEYSPKVFFSILIPCIICFLLLLFEILFNNSLRIKINIYIIYFVLICLFMIILWFLLGRIQITILGNEIIIKKKVLSHTLFREKIQKKDIDIIIFDKDVDSNYSVGTMGLKYYLKYDFVINIILKNNCKDYLLEIGSTIDSQKVLTFFKSHGFIIIGLDEFVNKK